MAAKTSEQFGRLYNKINRWKNPDKNPSLIGVDQMPVIHSYSPLSYVYSSTCITDPPFL